MVEADHGGNAVTSSPINAVVQHLRRAVLVRDAAGISDGQLLDSFITRRDEAAFEALLRRHGPMVLGVCRRLLRDPHEAEDAFQATFLVLVRKAASVVPRDRVPNWLHGVAYQTAVRARSAAIKRRRRERLVREMPELQAPSPEPLDDLRTLLDQQLAALPSNYRVAVVLCDLEGKAHKEVATQLGWPEGTLASRLSRGRKMLAARLSRRGVVLSAAMLSTEMASACVPTSLVLSTVRAACTGAVSVNVYALKEGVLMGMLLNKLKAVLLVGVVALAGGMVLRQLAAADPAAAEVKAKVAPSPAAEQGQKPAAGPTPKGAKDRFAVIAAGKRVLVQATLGGAELHAEAERVSYDNDVLILEAAAEDGVRVMLRRGEEEAEITGRKVVVHLKTGAVRSEGAGGVRVNVPNLGRVPVGLDFGFPVVKAPKGNDQLFNFFMGFFR
jgi:RNA polymerase sigma factor (sigma-70 family)